MNTLTIFKISYRWYEGEFEETLLAKAVSKEDFEKDLIEVKNFAESLMGIEIKEGSYLGKGYRVDCLPEYYQQVIWFLKEKKGYAECARDERIEYSIDDGPTDKLSIQKRVESVEWKNVPAAKQAGSEHKGL